MSNFLQPVNMEELQYDLSLLSRKSAIVAGGTDILVRMHAQDPDIDTFLNLNQISELREINVFPEEVRIGAMVTHQQAAVHPAIRQYFQALSQACGQVGSPQIRNRATIAGNLANASPAGDTLPCLFLFDAEIEVMDSVGERKTMAVEDFIRGAAKNNLAYNEVITSIRFPIKKDSFSIYQKLGTRSKVTISRIGLAMELIWQEGKPRQIKAYMGAISIKPVRISGLYEFLLCLNPGDKEKERLYQRMIDIISELTPEQFERDYKIMAAKGVAYDCIDNLWSSIVIE